MDTPKLDKWFPAALEMIKNERISQINKWGENDFDNVTDHKILTILSEEHGEIARAILEHDPDNLLEEITQLGALCAKWIEQILMERAQKEDKDNTCSIPGSSI